MVSDQNPDTLAVGHASDELASLREEFCGFNIWKEVIGERTRYIARSHSLGSRLHTVVTADLGELREALNQGAERQVAALPFDTRVPNIARMYNYWIGGKDHLAADRQAADGVTADFPEVAQVARANRKFVTRAVRYVAEQGITQFIDVGAGLPTGPAVHEIAQEVNPAARVAYVDNDKLVLAHARALLAGGPGVSVVAGDMRFPVKVLASRELQRLIDLGTPVCLPLASVLHFLEPDEADVVVAMFTQFIAPGSYLVLSAGTSTGTDPALIDRLRSSYAGTSVITGRAIEGIAAWFTGLGLVSPGLVDVQAWRPGGGRYRLRPPSARIVGAVGRKPMNADHVRRPGAFRATGVEPMTQSDGAQRRTIALDGTRLRELRRQHGLSQERLADRAGLSLTTVARLESQATSPCRGRTLGRLGEEPEAISPVGARAAGRVTNQAEDEQC